MWMRGTQNGLVMMFESLIWMFTFHCIFVMPKVINLTSVDGEWNWDVLNRWLPENLTCKIASMLPPSIDAGWNCRKGISVNENQFYVGAMYEILDEDSRLEKEERWNET